MLVFSFLEQWPESLYKYPRVLGKKVSVLQFYSFYGISKLNKSHQLYEEIFRTL